MIKAAGYSLLEILISLCILSGGLLGFAQAQLLALRSNQIAAMQSIAQIRLMALADVLQTCANAKCSESNLTDQIKNWNMINASVLPQGQGEITQQGNNQVIKLHWQTAATDRFNANTQARLIIPLSHASFKKP